MPAEVGEQGCQRGIVIGLQERHRCFAEIAFDPRPNICAALIMERRQDCIGKGIEPRLERRFQRQRSTQLLAVFELDHAPAAGAENLVEALEHLVGADRVEALAVVIEDPPQVADVMLGALDQRFVNIAFVEFGVADQSDEAAAIPIFHPAAAAEPVLDDAREQGDCNAKSDRPGREIDRDLVLGPAGIALCAAKPAEILELLARLRTEQIMDGVEDGPGVRLDRNPVIGAECMKI